MRKVKPNYQVLSSPKLIFSRSASTTLLYAKESSGADDVKVYRAKYRTEANANGISNEHLLVVNIGAATPAKCSIGAIELNHNCEAGNVTLIPAQMEWSASIKNCPEIVLVSIPPALISFASTRLGVNGAQFHPTLRGQDRILLSVIHDLMTKQALLSHIEWQNIVDELTDHLVYTHVRPQSCSRRGVLSSAELFRMNSYISTHLSELLSVDELADALNVSRSHFPRLLRRTTGISPLQYVIRFRLRLVHDLICRGMPIAEASFEAGFSHQSHMTNWMKRLRGVTPGTLKR